MSGLDSVNWYRLLLPRPPMRMAGGFWRNTRMPGTRFSFGCSSRITSSMVMCRSKSGRTNRRAASTMAARPP